MVKGASLTLRWSSVKDPSGVTYRVEIQAYSDKAGSYMPVRSVRGLKGTELSHTMSASRERWRVAAIDGAGNAGTPSPWSKYARATPVTPSSTTTTVILY